MAASFDDVWSERARGVIGDIAVDRDLSEQDVAYLKSRFPYLQLVQSGDFDIDQILPEIELIPASSGWNIQYHGVAMSSSVGDAAYTGFAEEGDDGEGGGSVTNPGKGTLVNQAFDTAQDMIAYAIEQGWPGASIADGHRSMQWAAWVGAKLVDFKLEGFEPTPVELENYQRLVESRPNWVKQQKKRLSVAKPSSKKGPKAK